METPKRTNSNIYITTFSCSVLWCYDFHNSNTNRWECQELLFLGFLLETGLYIDNDPMAEYCLDELTSLASEDERELLLNRKLSSALTSHITIRARKYDSIVNNFISQNLSSIDVIKLFRTFSERFYHSQIALEVDI